MPYPYLSFYPVGFLYKVTEVSASRLSVVPETHSGSHRTLAFHYQFHAGRVRTHAHYPSSSVLPAFQYCRTPVSATFNLFRKFQNAWLFSQQLGVVCISVLQNSSLLNHQPLQEVSEHMPAIPATLRKKKKVKKVSFSKI